MNTEELERKNLMKAFQKFLEERDLWDEYLSRTDVPFGYLFDNHPGLWIGGAFDWPYEDDGRDAMQQPEFRKWFVASKEWNETYEYVLV